MRLRDLVREPVLVFFALGGLLFALYLQLQERSEPITLSRAGYEFLLTEFETLTGSPVSEAQAQRQLQDYYQREVLFRQAIREGLHLSDSGVRDALIESMQQQVTGELREPEPGELVAFYGEHLERYQREASMSVDHVFYRERPQDPQKVLDQLNAGAASRKSPPEFASLGDSPWQGRSFPDYGHSMLRGLFGADILQTLTSMPLGTWMGPYDSVDGWHFFRVRDRRAARLLPFAQVQDQVRADYQSRRLAADIARYVDRYRERYPLILEAGDTP